MPKVNLFLAEFTQLKTWRMVFLFMLVFYVVGVLVLRMGTIWDFFTQFSTLEAFQYLALLLVSPFDTFTSFTLTVFLTSGFLLASQFVALRLYVIKKFLWKHPSVSMLGVFSSLLGCLACCGSIVVISLIGFFGLSLQMFPFGGQEIAVAGLCISFLSLLYTVNKIDSPLICKV